MFEELPQLFQQVQAHNIAQFQQFLSEPPPSAVTLRLLLDLSELAHLLNQITFLQLLHLTNNAIPQGPVDYQVQFLSKLQELFQSRDRETLVHQHNVLSETPLHLEVQQLMELERSIPFELIYLYGELLKLPSEELLSLQDWLVRLPPNRIVHLVKLLLIDPSVLCEIKHRLTLPSAAAAIQAAQAHLVTPSSSPAGLGFTPNSPLRVMNQPAPMPFPPPSSDPSNFKLRIARQPPSKTVYQRILKPFPSVMLATGNDVGLNLFVEVVLVRSDSEQELPLTLEGNKCVRISNGVFATFKKLKILSTSQMQGTLFRLKFLLKRYVGSVFEIIQGSHAISDPIEVFSHTLYLNTTRSEAPAPPAVIEVLPSHGSAAGNNRVVILGSRFVNSPNIRVRFGDVEVVPHFHEQGTLICLSPPHPPGGAPVRVANDGKHFCETKVVYNFG
jgi:hypothetical protein